MDSFRQDIRSALRVFRASPGFVLVTVLSLALGIGVNTTLFRLVTGVLLRPVPAADPARVMTLEKGGGLYIVSYPDYVDLRDRAHAMGGLAAWGELSAALATGDGVERAYGVLVSGNYFQVLGLRPALGRLLTPDDDQVQGAHPVVVLSHSSWRRRFGGDSGIVGRVVRLNGTAFTVTGVAPAGFTSTIAVF